MSSAPRPSERFGRYELVRLMGRGGMGEIWAARDTLLDRPVVIKRLRSHLSDNPAFVDMFLDEAQAAAKLAHPNVVKIYDLGMLDGTYFMAMERLYGWDLNEIRKQLHARGELLPVPVVLRLSPRTLSLSRSQPVTATIEIEPVTSARTFTDVPVIVRNRGWRSELESVEITLTGPMQALAAIGEDEVTVLVHVPDDVEGDSLMLSLGAESGARLEVLHPAADEVTVKKLSPSKLRVLGSGPPG